MKDSWSHSNPVRILAGSGSLKQLSQEVKAGRWLLVTTAGATQRGMTNHIQELLPNVVELSICDNITPNPELDYLEQLTVQYRKSRIYGLIAIGGGSVLDAAKVLSVTLPSQLATPLATSLRENKGQVWRQSLPVIAIPTTSGTGAEVTSFATVWDQTSHQKYSVISDLVYPYLALLDPTLTLSLPCEETLYTGLDAVSHALESLWNVNRTPVSQSFSVRSLELAVTTLPKVLEDLNNVQARAAMQQSSVLAGLAISQTRTAIAHSISYPLTSFFGVPHGLACSFTLPKLIDHYLAARPLFEFAELMRRAQVMLTDLELQENLWRYVDAQQVLKLQDKMLHPDRATHFDAPIDSSILKDLLCNA